MSAIEQAKKEVATEICRTAVDRKIALAEAKLS